MKKTLFAFRWVVASFILGFGVLGLLMISGLYVPSGTFPTPGSVPHRALYTGLAIWIFLIGLPLVTLILAIREVSTGYRCEKDLVQE
jgi:hypothetical protein